MLPSVFRALLTEDTLLRTHSRKVSKKGMIEQLFPFAPGIGLPGEVEWWNLDF